MLRWVAPVSTMNSPSPVQSKWMTEDVNVLQGMSKDVKAPISNAKDDLDIRGLLRITKDAKVRLGMIIWTRKYDNGIMAKALEPFCDCLHQVVTAVV